MDVPGMEAKDIDVQVHGNTITLRGKRAEEKRSMEKHFIAWNATLVASLRTFYAAM